ncbi:hypothetical protein BDQ12DRAFT_392897 [Crucibulum laeve]|uniref:Uncharacterized protein n=1 Tax=Crucibulum laeve TaxID=68775 RepID=A0A5C3M8F5_9AGAR|nr:hypothetical protein BDQ12DRAFT_392897 [Crucibulum laeve]
MSQESSQSSQLSRLSITSQSWSESSKCSPPDQAFMYLPGLNEMYPTADARMNFLYDEIGRPTGCSSRPDFESRRILVDNAMPLPRDTMPMISTPTGLTYTHARINNRESLRLESHRGTSSGTETPLPFSDEPPLISTYKDASFLRSEQGSNASRVTLSKRQEFSQRDVSKLVTEQNIY